MLRVPALTAVVPRFSRHRVRERDRALVASGIGSALQHFPTLDSLWDTSYGKSLVLKLIFLGGTIAIAAVNFGVDGAAVRARRRAYGADGSTAASVLRVLVSGEVLLVVGAFFGAALLTSLPPPPKALASLGAINAHVGSNGPAHGEEERLHAPLPLHAQQGGCAEHVRRQDRRRTASRCAAPT